MPTFVGSAPDAADIPTPNPPGPPDPPIPPPLGGGTTYYLATTGNDSDPGGVLDPFLTLGHFWSIAGPGDNLRVRGGTFSGAAARNMDLHNTYGDPSGTSGAPITVTNYTDEVPIFDGGANGSTNSDRYWLLANGPSSFITINGIKLINYNMNQNGIITVTGGSSTASGWILSNLDSQQVGGGTCDATNQNIYWGANVQGALVDTCILRGPYPTTPTTGAGVGTDHYPAAQDVTVRDCTFINCHKGTQIYGSPGGSPSGVTIAILDNVYTNCGRNIELVWYQQALVTGNTGTIASESPTYNLYDSGNGVLTASNNTWT